MQLKPFSIDTVDTEIKELLISLTGSFINGEEWLESENEDFDNKRPIDVIRTIGGTKQVIKYLQSWRSKI